MVPRGGSNDVLHAGLGNTRGSYCNSNSRGSELPGIGQFLSPVEFEWKELIRTRKARNRIGIYA